MFNNIFPKNLINLCLQVYPHHRLQAIMLPLVSIRDYQHLAEHLPEDRKLMSSVEIEQAESFTQAKRQQEWLTTRICAKLGSMRFCAAAPGDSNLIPYAVSVVNNRSGRPSLTGDLPPEFSQVDISLSHGAGFGLALLADAYCGIDIEQPRKALIRTMARYCTPEEEGILHRSLSELPLTQQLCIVWAAKEAGKKALSHRRMPGFSELILTQLTPHTGGWEMLFMVSSRQFDGYPTAITVAAEVYQDFSLAICLTGETGNA